MALPSDPQITQFLSPQKNLKSRRASGGYETYQLHSNTIQKLRDPNAAGVGDWRSAPLRLVSELMKNGPSPAVQQYRQNYGCVQAGSHAPWSLVSEFIPRGHHGVIGQVNLVPTDSET